MTCSTPTTATSSMQPARRAPADRRRDAARRASSCRRETASAAARSRRAAAARRAESRRASSRCGPVKSTTSASRGPAPGRRASNISRACGGEHARRRGHDGRRVVDGDEHFAEARLAEVVGQHVDVAPADLVRVGPGLVRRAAHQPPQRVDHRRRPARPRPSGDPSSRHQNAPRKRRRLRSCRAARTAATARTPTTTSTASTTARGTIVGRTGGLNRISSARR